MEQRRQLGQVTGWLRRYQGNGLASLPTGFPPVCKSPQRGHMAARKGIHPSHDDRPWPTLSPGSGCQQDWASLPFGGAVLAPPRTGAWFSVPLDQPQCAMPDPLVTNVQGHILSSLLWNFLGPSLCPTPFSCLRRGQQAKNSNRCSF